MQRPVGEPSDPAAEARKPTDVFQRYHSLDFLRGSMMLLGIVFHCAIAYDNTTAAAYKNWPTSEVLGFVVVGSHGFRMPIFFVLAGFFAALLFSRRTTPGFVSNRATRIGIPLVTGWAVLSPIVGSGLVFTIAAFFLGRSVAIDLAWEMTKRGDFFFNNDTLHLWFLHYLLLFYAAMVLLSPLARRISLQPDGVVAGRFRALMGGWWRVPTLAVPTLGVLYVRPMADSATPTSFVPDAEFLLLYGFFFGFGVVLYSARDMLTSFQRGAWPSLAMGLALAGVYKIAVERWLEGGASAEQWNLVAIAVNAAMIWLLFFGLVGVLLRHLDRSIPAVRYIADASYWFYLIHFPIAAWLPGLLVGLEWAPEVKFAVVLSTVLTICLVTYELFVRSTYVGTILNGRRYPSLVWTGRQKGQVLGGEPAQPNLSGR
jgi:glucan biosynthesis protein C